MSPRFLLPGLALLCCALPGIARAQPSPALLTGTFALTGRITAAVHVSGEHVGQQVSRTWTFTPACSSSPCTQVSLLRSRAAGTDAVTLHLNATGTYSGTGSFYAPLTCNGHLNPQGERVPFLLAVRVTATRQTSTGAIASAISATYTNRKRVNRTKCVALPSHDAAVYTGTLTSG
jgi:hypothetical protein